MKILSIIFWVLITTSLFSQTRTHDTTPTKYQLDSLKTELGTLFMKDQTFRRIFKEAEKKLGKESEAYA